MANRKRVVGIAASVLILALFSIGLAVVLPAQAATEGGIVCVRHKHVENWNNFAEVEAHGFFINQIGEQSSLGFGVDDSYKFLSLDLDVTPNFAGEYIASRITEIDDTFPVDQRVKCWQPTADENIIVETALRFDQPLPLFGLTENIFLWNAPFGENPLPITAIGVTRSIDLSTFQPQYSAIVSQDLILYPEFSGLLVTEPMPAWLNASDWHMVRITVSQDSASIEVAQGAYAYTPVLQIPLLHTPEMLGFEFSVDNEAFPGLYAPIIVPDGLDIGFVDIRLSP